MSTRLILSVRVAGLLVFAWMLILAIEFRRAAPAQGPQNWSSSAHEAAPLAELLLREYPELLNEAIRGEITAALQEHSQGLRTVQLTSVNRTSMTFEEVKESLEKADGLFQSAGQRLSAAFGHITDGVDLSGVPPFSVHRTVLIPYNSTALMLRRQANAATIPRFVNRKVDLTAPDPIRIDLGSASNFVCLLELTAPGTYRQRHVELTAGPDLVARLDLSVTVPPKFPLRVEIVDGEGHPTGARLGLYSPEKKLLVPVNALDFSAGGYNYQPVTFRDGINTRYWPGGERYTRCFFLKGAFTIDLPVGAYRLIAAKGPEFVPIDRSVTIGAAGRTEKVELRRWIDMSARGWHSGDDHIHYARPDQRSNQQLLLWMEAEDLRIGNILRAGDGRATYFEQYAFGKAGRFVQSSLALVPGQEDPRTRVLGHTINLNLLRPVRDLERGYYLYGVAFDDTHRQGGLTGFAHVNSGSFNVVRGMTIEIARNRVDFSEICQLGQVGTALWYEFLNLGFRMTAAGGSDVPWGGNVGDSRMYVYTGGAFTPDQWFGGVRKGHTFVTAGPMLDFTVSGHLPGDEFTATKGENLKIHARAMTGSSAVRLDPLEIVANGDVIRTGNPGGASASLDFELPADRSMWIAARVTGAHTTPVYITVDGKRHWKSGAVPALLEKRLTILKDIDKLIDEDGTSINPGREIEWENAESFRRGTAELRNMVREAREIYLQLRREYEASR